MSPNGQAIDALLTSEPGVHFLGHPTRSPTSRVPSGGRRIADNGSFEQWDLDGAKDANVRANAVWKKMLADYEAPPFDDAIDEALLEFVARKKASFPDSNA